MGRTELKEIKVIAVEECLGRGIEQCPCFRVTAYYNHDGKLLGYNYDQVKELLGLYGNVVLEEIGLLLGTKTEAKG